MEEETAREISRNLGLISRALAVLCVTSEPFVDQPLGVHARLLNSVGFEKDEIADILNSTSNSIGVRLSETKNWREKISKSGKGSGDTD